MVSMPVAQMLDRGKCLLIGPEDLFLILALLEEGRGRSSSIWTWTYHAEKANMIMIFDLFIGAYETTASFVRVELITFIEYRLECFPGDCDGKRSLLLPKHGRRSSWHILRTALAAAGRFSAIENVW